MKPILSFTLAVSLFATSVCVAQSQERRPPRRPPPEAVAACGSKKDGDACNFKAPHGEVTGTCHPCQDQLACVPPHPPREDQSKEGSQQKGPKRQQQESR